MFLVYWIKLRICSLSLTLMFFFFVKISKVSANIVSFLSNSYLRYFLNLSHAFTLFANCPCITNDEYLYLLRDPTEMHTLFKICHFCLIGLRNFFINSSVRPSFYGKQTSNEYDWVFLLRFLSRLFLYFSCWATLEIV